MSQFKYWAACAVLFFIGSTAYSLGPHECIILVNRQSMASMELANYYADLRKIPDSNIIHLDLPGKALEARPSFTPAEFRDFIYEPTRKILRERNLSGHILAWLYSVDFPCVISTEPPISLTGMTFVRGQPPPPEQVDRGSWISPMFRGPDTADGPAGPPATLEEFTIRLTTNMPIPSMMIGWAGTRGMTVPQIKQQLRAAASGDGAHPSASIYFELSEDVRAKTRAWQFAPATTELAGLGVAAFTASNPPTDRKDLMGVLAGRRFVDTASYGMGLRPGAYADHLTSLAAVFHDPNQTKLTEWLKVGAAGSAGTVHEPYSNWMKFPGARLFTHYASGCTLLESLYQATRCPLQILFVGDALCSPWMKPPGITLVNMADDEGAPIVGKAEFLASSWSGFGQIPPATIFFLDGRPINQPGNQAQLSINSARLNDGYHELRAVAYASESIRHQGFDIKNFVTRNRERSVELGGFTNRQQVDLYHPLTFQIRAEGSPREAAVISQERVLIREPYTSNMTLSVRLDQIGAGPVRFQAVVVYPDNEAVRSNPLLLDIQLLNTAPVIQSITISTNSEQDIALNMDTADAENDPLLEFWYMDLLRGEKSPELKPEDQSVEWNRKDGTITLSATSTTVCATFEIDQPNRVRDVRARMSVQSPGSTDRFQGGIVFNYMDDNNYLFWGGNGYSSAWTLTRVRDGQPEIIMTRGAPMHLDKEIDLMLLAIGPQKIGLFVNDDLKAIADVSFGAGRIGVLSGVARTRFDHLLVSPPSACRTYFSEQQDGLVIKAAQRGEIETLRGAARDVQYTTTRRVLDQ